ncbi:glycosyltransferase family 39 protein [Roseibium denhamense]|uniref:Dolichyl-phosphate-mannose-protein mannosyltransferase n=1 Tax=Roseibium denhamense TaxID=76305 RepID=A0ABY1PGL2_9HYPH|nr:glycosyltransferase family 39 protein [Roseibium denhamense]MTI04716.1 glycosyltransferase family 39 protein [Roseibium denhamense]SMP33659.1 Dolichyl-phosphate-mannose-protein mannosyltransferase [Roseibium denhamense]
MPLDIAEQAGSAAAPPSAVGYKDFLVLGFLILLVALTQVGTLNAEVLDWDESSFALMAQSVSRGNLPFVELFDLKPPVMFFALGAWITLFGESLLAIRLFGDLCLIVIVVFTYGTARRLVSPVYAGVGALLLVVLSGSFFAQHTQTEHLAMAFLMPAIWLLTGNRPGLFACVLAGALVALAVLTRSNLALVPIAIGLVLLLDIRAKSLSEVAAKLASYCLGGLCVLGLIVATYWVGDELPTLKLALIDVPLAYSGRSDGSVLNTIRLHAVFWGGRILHDPLVYVPATLLLGGITLLVALKPMKFIRLGERAPKVIPVVIAVLVAIGVLLVLGGVAYPHYWNQLLPLFGVLLACACALVRHFRIAVLSVGTACLVMVLAVVSQKLPSAISAFHNWKDGSFDYPILKVAKAIEADSEGPHSVWALNYHLVHFYLGAPLLSRGLTHPANIFPPSSIHDALSLGGYIDRDEIGRVMEAQPKYLVVKDLPPWYASKSDGERLVRWVQENYVPVVQYEDVKLYKRR